LRHDKWLSMMYPRLALLRDLLAESGALFMTLDDHESHHARVLMDDIFGPENFLANITWERTRTPEDTGAPFLETHTNVFAYARNAGYKEGSLVQIQHRPLLCWSCRWPCGSLADKVSDGPIRWGYGVETRLG
jgi:hypothetical protein